MINVNNLKPGITFLYNKSDILIVIESIHSKNGRCQANVKVKAKNLRTQKIININFTGGNIVYPAIINKIKAFYSYDYGIYSIFIDNKNYNEIKINKSRLKWEKNFLVPGEKVLLIIYKNFEILNINLPASVILKVVDVPNIKNNNINKNTKIATLETGLQLQVPLFINNNDKIIVSTNKGKYKNRI